MENEFCFNCGTQIDPVSKICPACGMNNMQGRPLYDQQNYNQYQQSYAQQTYNQSPYMQRQTPQPYDQTVYMTEQPYYNAQPYQTTMQPVRTSPSVVSIIIGLALILIGLPVSGLFGIGALGLFARGQISSAFISGIIALLALILCVVGVKQFLPRKSKQSQIMQQLPQNNNWNNYPPLS